MKDQFHGVFSLILIIAAIVIGLFHVFGESNLMGIGYLAIVLISTAIILYAFCAKCVCRDDSCRHVFPGKLTRLFPSRQQGPYHFGDLFWTVLALAALFLFPQPWLWNDKGLLIAFWAIAIVAIIEIQFFVCTGCGNKGCPIQRLRG